MNFRRYLGLAAVVLFVPALAAAQDFGVMESAETINRGNVKLGAYPMFLLPDPGDNETGLGVTVGYGVNNWVDIEGRAAFYPNVKFVGGDVEFWLVKNQPLDLSARGGFHLGFSDGGRNSRGLDFSLIGSAPVARRLEVFGALDLAFNSFDGFDDDFTTVHFVPGIEFAISPDLDFLAELGVGANDRSRNYVAVGLSFYFR